MNHRSVFLTVLTGLILAGATASTAFAEDWAYTDPGAGTQTGGSPILLAQSFSVTAGNAISVDNIGVFINQLSVDNSSVAYGSPSHNLEVAIVNSTGTVVAGTDTTFTAGTSYYNLNGNDIYQSLSSPVTLGAGSYWLEALGYEDPDPNGNTYSQFNNPPPVTDDGGGLLTFGTSEYTYPNGIAFGVPATVDGLGGATQPQYQIGTFSFENAAPEPGTFGLFGIAGALVFGVVRRRNATRMRSI